MWKILILLFFNLATSQTSENSIHLQELQSAFPYGLLTDDFGILTKEDLKINTCGFEVVPFSEKSTSYPYWQCFEITHSKLDCEGSEYDPEEKERVTVMVISARLNGELHEYLSRRVISLSTCRLFQRAWQKLLKNEKYVCISGPLNFIEKGKQGKRWSWIFDKYKTKKGCDSYFIGDCSLKYQIEHHHCNG